MKQLKIIETDLRSQQHDRYRVDWFHHHQELNKMLNNINLSIDYLDEYIGIDNISLMTFFLNATTDNFLYKRHIVTPRQNSSV